MANRKPSPEDVELFRRSVGAVQPVGDARRAPGSAARPHDAPRTAARSQTRADAPSLAHAEAGERLSYVRPGLQHRLLRQLRRGQFRVEDELHLRGLTAAEALRFTADFLDDAQSRGARCVRMIHGKGHGSADGRPVIKGELDHWLREQPLVDAFCSARDVDGGSGALYVLLKRRT